MENTHEPLVSKEDFARVQELIATRRRQQKDGSTQIFSGLVKCADCGWSLAFSTNRQNKKPYSYYHCSKNGQGLHQCTMHYIRYDVLYTYVLARVQYWAGQAALNEEHLVQRLLRSGDKERTASQKKQTTELNKAEKRKAELDHLFAKMYEDWAAGRITGRVSAQRLAALLRQVSKRSPPNRTYTSRCIRLSRYQSNFPLCSFTWQEWHRAIVLRLRAIIWRSHSALPLKSFSFRT